MLTREDLANKSQEEIVDILQGDIAAFRAEVETIETDEMLQEKERELMMKFDEYQSYLATAEYDLPKEATFRTQNFTAPKIHEMIVECLEGVEVEFSYTPAILDLCEFWATKGIEKVKYNQLDATLRFLPMRKYKGIRGCKTILTVNEYLTPLHEAYSRDTNYHIYLSELHNAVLDQYKRNHPELQPETDMPEPTAVTIQ